MKQTISKQMDGSLITQQYAVNQRLFRTVQTTLYDYIEACTPEGILEVSRK